MGKSVFVDGNVKVTTGIFYVESATYIAFIYS